MIVRLPPLFTLLFFFFLLIPPPPRSTLFPYTTLFRSISQLRLNANLTSVVAILRIRRVLFLDGANSRIRPGTRRSEEHTSELQSRGHLVCRLLLEKKKTNNHIVC